MRPRKSSRAVTPKRSASRASRRCSRSCARRSATTPPTRWRTARRRSRSPSPSPARPPDGYGLVAALGTTLRRLRMHLTDVANLEPLALLVLVPKTKNARLAQALVVGHVLAYAPFYFDGNYPGGGARFYADILPIE